jgi:hypothetical protein
MWRCLLTRWLWVGLLGEDSQEDQGGEAEVPHFSESMRETKDLIQNVLAWKSDRRLPFSLSNLTGWQLKGLYYKTF